MDQEQINGSDMMMFSGGKSISGATSCKLSISAETNDTSNKDAGGGMWGVSSIKRLNWEGSSDNMFMTNPEGNSFDELYDAMKEGKPIDFVYSKAKTSDDKKLDDVPTGGWTIPTTGIYKGKVIITSLDANAPSGDTATFSVAFKGVGELKRIDAAS